MSEVESQAREDIPKTDDASKIMPPPAVPEKEQEAKLRAKYPGLRSSGGNALLQKRLSKGQQKYFDSGDYNMAKAKMGGAASKKPIPPNQKLLLGTSTGEAIPTPESIPHHTHTKTVQSKLAADGMS